MIVEFTIQQPTLLEALREVPSTRLIWQQTTTTDNDEQLLVFWAESDNYAAFEAAIYEDSTVTGPRTLTEFSDRRLYQVEQTAEGRAQSIIPTIMDAGGIIKECTVTHEGWSFQVQFPDNDSLNHVHEACLDHDLGFTLHRKYKQTDDTGEQSDYGLTAKQHEMVAHAADHGYYNVPRETDLEDLSEELNISHQAASERLRRGIDMLVRHTVLRETNRPPEEEE